jgi:hypothetical protein
MLDKNTIKLLRIPFSILLMPVFMLAWSQVEMPYSWLDVFIPFVILHLLIYPASNGYNSYVDRDEGSIGGLEKPPMPTENLFYVTLMLDIIALLFIALCFGLTGVQCATNSIEKIPSSRIFSGRYSARWFYVLYVLFKHN